MTEKIWNDHLDGNHFAGSSDGCIEWNDHVRLEEKHPLGSEPCSKYCTSMNMGDDRCDCGLHYRYHGGG
jgi:hypothetical protein